MESVPTLWQLRRSVWLAQQVHETGPLGAAQWVGIASFHWSIKCLELHAQGESINQSGHQGSIRQDNKVTGRAPDLRALARSSNFRLRPASLLTRGPWAHAGRLPVLISTAQVPKRCLLANERTKKHGADTFLNRGGPGRTERTATAGRTRNDRCQLRGQDHDCGTGPSVSSHGCPPAALLLQRQVARGALEIKDRGERGQRFFASGGRTADKSKLGTVSGPT